MLTKRKQKMNVGLLKNIRKCEHISKKSVIGFKGNGNEILREDNAKEMKNRAIKKYEIE